MVTMALAGAAAEKYFCDPLDDGSDQIDLEMARRYLIRAGFGPLQIGAETLSPTRRCRPASRLGAPAHSPDCDALLQRGSLTGAKGGPCIHGPPRAFEEKDEEVEIEDLKRAKS